MKGKEWDWTSKNHSQMTLSPQERKLRNQASIKATNAHRTASPLSSSNKDIKKVNWKEWNLRDSVDFDSELENYVPLFNATPTDNIKKVESKSSNSQNLNKAQKDALDHLKNVLTNSLSDQTSVEISESVKMDQMTDDISALLIRFIMESKKNDQEREKEFSDLKNQVLLLKRDSEEFKDDLDACQLIVSSQQRRIQDLESLVENQTKTIKDQEKLLMDHMSSKEALENIKRSMTGLRF